MRRLSRDRARARRAPRKRAIARRARGWRAWRASALLAIFTRAAAVAVAMMAVAPVTFAAEDAEVEAAAPAGAAITSPAEAARRDLEKSLATLADLRARIQRESLPLTQELGTLETRLANEKNAFEETSRRIDAARLALDNSAQTGKLRQDEAGYVANLLDEYARGFETMLAPGETPRLKPVIEQATSALQDKDLGTEERLGRQVALMRASIARLEEAAGGARFEGNAVEPTGRVSAGTFGLVGPVALFAAKGEGSSGIALAQAGSPTPAVRPIDEERGTTIASLLEAGRGLLPLDPSRGGALAELIQRGSLIGYFKKGGPIMWPLLAVSILTLTVIGERMYFLVREKRRRQPRVIQAIMASLEAGDVDGALRSGLGSRDFVARALTYALTHRQKSFSDALMRATSQEMVRFNRGIPILDTVVTMAPMLGLLGTVTGIMSSFGMLGGAELGAPAQITGGIAEALIATAFGLGIAIVTLLPMNVLHVRSEEVRHELEDAATHLELLMKPILEEARWRRPAPVIDRVNILAGAAAWGRYEPAAALEDARGEA